MSRLMSVSKTTNAVYERRKTVTRRLGWWEDKNGKRLLLVGDRLTLCPKVMGRKEGDPLIRIAEVEVIDVRRERLNAITAADVEREGVDLPPGFSGPVGWAAWFAGEMRCPIDTEVTRIEWRYIDCECPYTDPKYWLSAASCGYGSGYEPGSMQEYNPDCPLHGEAS